MYIYSIISLSIYVLYLLLFFYFFSLKDAIRMLYLFIYIFIFPNKTHDNQQPVCFKTMNVQAFFHPRSQLCCAVCGRVPGMCCFPSDPVAVSWITCHFSLCPAGPAVVPSLIVLCSLFFFSLSVLWAPPVYRAIVFHLLRNTKTPVCSE